MLTFEEAYVEFGKLFKNHQSILEKLTDIARTHQETIGGLVALTGSQMDIIQILEKDLKRAEQEILDLKSSLSKN